MHGRPQHSSWHTVDTLPVTTVIIYLAFGSLWDLVLVYLRPLYTLLTPLQGSCHPASPAAMPSPESPETGPAHPAFSSIPSLSQLAPLCSPPVFPEPCLPGSIPYGLEDRLPLLPGQLRSPPLWVQPLVTLAMLHGICLLCLTHLHAQCQAELQKVQK